MPKHTTKLIVNPNADLGRAWRTASDLRPIIEELGGADWSGTVYPTHAIELARQAGEEGYQLVIAVGGDGTVHEVINGLMQLPVEVRPKLGIVPLGSGNDFAHNLGLPKDAGQALRNLMNGQSKPYDLGRMQDEQGRIEYWNNTMGIGFDTTTLLRSRKMRHFTGFLGYLVAVLQTIILDHEPIHMQLKIDSEQKEETVLMLVMLNGNREGGGFKLYPEAKPDDGMLHYVSVKNITRLRMLYLLIEVMRENHLKYSEVKHGSFMKMDIQSDRPMYIHTDGEIFSGFGSNVRHLTIELLPSCLWIQS
jgi:diacylglycerol kinase (ATP)